MKKYIKQPDLNPIHMLYADLVKVYEKLESTSSRLEKTRIISELLRECDEDDLKHVVLLLQGRVFPNWDERKIGMAAKLMIKALNIATGIENDKIVGEWSRVGDLGEVGSSLMKKKRQMSLLSADLKVAKVFSNIKKLAGLQGSGTVDMKVKLVAELLTCAKPDEAKYVVRTVLEDLRVGVAAGTLRDAIVWANFSQEIGLAYDEKKDSMTVGDREKYDSIAQAVQESYDASNDFVKVALAATRGIEAIKGIGFEVGVPLKLMLAQKVSGPKEGFEKVGKPAAIEYKYDGFRLQVHKFSDKVMLFTRNLENVTEQFPDVVAAVKEHVTGENLILDGETVGYDPKTRKYLPFQFISQRIRRKYGIAQMAEELPVELNVFDVLFFDNKSMIGEDFKKRRELLLNTIKQEQGRIVVANQIVTDDPVELDRFYRKALEIGNEGVMMKKLDAPYKPGARVGYMVKIKPTMETLDLVIVGAEWGTGKRATWFSSFTLACIDDDGNFLEIGKVGTGIGEKEDGGEADEGKVTFKRLTELLTPLILSEKGREAKIKPEAVVEIEYEEIQKSPTYGSGFALRFPRLVNLREDKPAQEASSIEMVRELFKGQKKREG